MGSNEHGEISLWDLTRLVRSRFSHRFQSGRGVGVGQMGGSWCCDCWWWRGGADTVGGAEAADGGSARFFALGCSRSLRHTLAVSR